jgi:hypothetical protein
MIVRDTTSTNCVLQQMMIIKDIRSCSKYDVKIDGVADCVLDCVLRWGRDIHLPTYSPIRLTSLFEGIATFINNPVGSNKHSTLLSPVRLTISIPNEILWLRVNCLRAGQP